MMIIMDDPLDFSSRKWLCCNNAFLRQERFHISFFWEKYELRDKCSTSYYPEALFPCIPGGIILEKHPAFCTKNLGRLWLAYTELQGDVYMLQLIYVDSRHFTQWYLSLGWSDLLEIKNIIFCIKEPPLWQYQVRIWACSGTNSHWKGSWALID